MSVDDKDGRLLRSGEPLADVARLHREYNRAIEMLKETLNLYRELGNKSEPPFSLEALARSASTLEVAGCGGGREAG